MAIYHLHVSMVSRKTGRSSVAAAAYRAGEKLHNEYDGVTHDYTNRSSISAAAYRAGEKLTTEQGETHDFTNKRGVVYNEIMLPDNAPDEYMNREKLWNAVEKAEKRCDAQTARDIDVALPVEFNLPEQIEIMREYIQDNFVSQGMCADFAIHDKGDGNVNKYERQFICSSARLQSNPHAHILLTTREVSEKGFGAKNRDWNKTSYLKSWRENWAQICNEKLQAKGLDDHIDHRTLKAQGIDREPTIHIGVTAKAMERKGIITERVKENQEIIARNEARNVENTAEYIHDLKEGYLILDREISVLKKDAIEAKQEMNIERHTAEEITERAENIQTLEKRIEELKAERQVMGFFESKKIIDIQIQRLEHSQKQAENFFKQSYNITPEQAEIEIKKHKNNAESKKHLYEKLQDKLTPLVEEQEAFKLEYQRQKLLSEIRPDKQKIQDRLKQLDKESRLQRQSAQDSIARSQSERKLDMMADRDFGEILKGMQPEQAEELIKNRERERIRKG